MILVKEVVLKKFNEMLESKDMADVREKVDRVSQWIRNLAGLDTYKHTQAYKYVTLTDVDTVVVREEIFHKQLGQIRDAKTKGRADHYINRMIKSFGPPRTTELNDIDLNRWEEYEHIRTESLWIDEKRSTGEQMAGDAGYHGNFIPEIPKQLILRYTKPGEWVMDPFLGSGTTLFQCLYHDRHGIGVELQPEVAKKTWDKLEDILRLGKKNLGRHIGKKNLDCHVVTGDSRHADFTPMLKQDPNWSCQLLILHPPYHGIVKFGNDPACLSNREDVDEFLLAFKSVASNCLKWLDSRRYVGLVIGDIYEKSKLVPLGFKCMQVLEDLGCDLKATIVKNIEGTAGKRGQEELWKYRALANGTFRFSHEYLFVMRKR